MTTYVLDSNGYLNTLPTGGGNGTAYNQSLNTTDSVSFVNVNVTSNIASTSTTNGALVVTGGVGISGNLNVGGNVFINGTQYVPANMGVNIDTFTASTGQTTFTLSNPAAGQVMFHRNGMQLASNSTISNGYNVVYNSSVNSNNTLVAGDRIDISYVYGNVLSIPSTSVNTDVSSVKITGGSAGYVLSTTGSGGVLTWIPQWTSLFTGGVVSGDTTFTSGSNSVSTTSGSIVLTGKGGIGTGGNINVGGNVNTINGKLTVGTNIANAKALFVTSSGNFNDGIYYENSSTGSSARALISINTYNATGLSIGQSTSTKNGFLYLGDNANLSISTNGAAHIVLESTGKTNFYDNINISSGNIFVDNKQAVNGPTFSAYQSIAQTIPSATATKVQFQTKEWDTHSCFDNITNYRFMPTIAGYYQVDGAVAYNAFSTINVSAGIYLYKNSASYKIGMFWTDPTVTAVLSAVSALVYLNGTTDYIELWTYHNDVSAVAIQALSTTTYFNAVMTRGA